MDKISIIIPAFNSSSFISDCLTSVVNQTYTNLDIIVVDDGSSDDTFNVYQKIAGSDKRIRVVAKENGGTASARNFGIKLAKGSYLSFIDSDDVVDKNFVNFLYKGIKKYNSVFSFCTFLKFEQSAPIIEEEKLDCYLFKFNDFFSYNNCSKRGAVIACAKLFDARLFKSILFKEGTYHEDDFLFNSLFKSKADKISFINQPLYFYRQHSDSKSFFQTNDFPKIDLIYALFERIEIGASLNYDCFSMPCLRRINELIFFYKWNNVGDELKNLIKKFAKLNIKYSNGPRIRKIKYLFMFLWPYFFMRKMKVS